MSDIAPSVPMPVLKTEPGGNLTHVGDINNGLIGVSQLSSVVIGMSGNANSGGIMMPTIINDESISEPQSPISSGIFNFKQSSQWDFYAMIPRIHETNIFFFMHSDVNDHGISTNKNELMTASTMAGGAMLTNCAICGDRATGKHYGASSCDGCKGIFFDNIFITG